MLKMRPLQEISTPQLSVKKLIRSALLACLVGAGNPGCAVHADWLGYTTYPAPVYVTTPRGRVPCVPPLPTVSTVGRRPYYFARPLAPTTVIISPSHGYYLCP